MYALNVVANVFEGELAAFSAGGTSVQGMFVANQGAGGPWAPLGILYYVPIYIVTKLFGTTLIALRLSSAVVGVLSVPLVYLLASRLGGRLAGYLAAALFSLNILHIGWSRTDVHPHGVTTWPTLLLCYALLKAYDTRKLGWAGAVAFMMGLSWHQYPSGQSAVLIPLLAIGFFWITNRLSLPFSKKVCALVWCGLIVWFLGFPLGNYLADGNFRFLNPFTLTGPRASWSAGNAPEGKFELFLLVANSTLLHVGTVLKGLFFRQSAMCHQEWLIPPQGTLMRTVPWLEMPFVFMGLALLWRYRARFETAVMVGWLVAAILPGVLSEQAYPKRLSTFYPALDIVAALALATLVYYREERGRLGKWLMTATISGVILGFLSLATHFWFSGRFWRYGEPGDVQATAKLAQAIRPDTILVEYMPEGYDRAKYLFLLVDTLTQPERRPNRWLLASSDQATALLADPRGGRDAMSRSWVYNWTRLRDQRDESLTYNGWKRVVFLLQTPAPHYRVDEKILEAASTRCAHPKIEHVDAPKPFVMIECELDDLR
jgi:4-amino-4-deoxy-L-arabinose transferase-like glycosyltransferase